MLLGGCLGEGEAWLREKLLQTVSWWQGERVLGREGKKNGEENE